MRVALILALVVALPLAGAYPDPDKVPVYYQSECFAEFDKRFVHDYVGLFGASDAGLLERASCETYTATSAHFVVVTVPQTEGETLENYALHLFEEWGIGDEKRLDGLMLLYVEDYLQSGSSSARIEVGYGLEGVVSSTVTEDVWDFMIDARDRALDAGEDARSAKAYGILAASSYLLDTLLAEHTEAGFPPPEPRSEAPPILFWILVILVVIVIVALLNRASRGARGWGYHAGSGAWSRGYGSSWAPPGSFGGGSFGGGRSGGGGRGGRF